MEWKRKLACLKIPPSTSPPFTRLPAFMTDSNPQDEALALLMPAIYQADAKESWRWNNLGVSESINPPLREQPCSLNRSWFWELIWNDNPRRWKLPFGVSQYNHGAPTSACLDPHCAINPWGTLEHSLRQCLSIDQWYQLSSAVIMLTNPFLVCALSALNKIRESSRAKLSECSLGHAEPILDWISTSPRHRPVFSSLVDDSELKCKSLHRAKLLLSQ
jgi:hypothetical protein